MRIKYTRYVPYVPKSAAHAPISTLVVDLPHGHAVNMSLHYGSTPPPPPVKARPPRLQTQSPARDTNSFIPSPVYIFLIAILLLLTLALTRTNNNNNNLAFPHIRAATTWAVINATSIIPSEPPDYNKHTNLATFRGVHDTSATQRYRMMARCPDGMLCKDCYCGPSLCARLAGVMPLALQNNDGIACECFWTAFVNTSHCQFQMNLRCHH